MKNLTRSLIICAALVTAAAPQAFADGSRGKARYAASDYAHYQVDHRRHSRGMPHWMREHREFRRWYGSGRYHRHYNLSWYRLWDVFVNDRRYHRKHHRKYRDSYRDGYDSYYDGYRGRSGRHSEGYSYRRYRH